MAEKKNRTASAGKARAGKKKVTKTEAVRRALQTLGNNAMPTQIQNWVKDEFGLTMTKDHISTSKGAILRKGAGGEEARPAAATKQASPPRAAAAPRESSANGRSTIQLQDILTLQTLVEHVGSEQLRTLIDVMSK